MIPFDWPAGVPIKLQRQGYSREPQDLVQRLQVDAGPPLRRLIDGAAGQKVRGTLAMSQAESVLFETWRLETLDRGMGSFNWVITDNGRAVEARFAAQPKLTRAVNRWRYELEIDCAPGTPSAVVLEALADLEDAGPATWPVTVPFRPMRTGFALQPMDQVLRSPDGAVHRQALKSRAEGSDVDIVLQLTTAELSAFEAWFAAEAAFGARDVLFPSLAGGTHFGGFSSGYKIGPAASLRWAVSFKIYLEAVA